MKVGFGRDDRRPGTFHPLDFNEQSLTDEEQLKCDRHDMLLNMSTAGLCILHAYGIAAGKNTIVDDVMSGCLIANTAWDAGVQAVNYLNAPFKMKSS